jgi:hypothetical protein
MDNQIIAAAVAAVPTMIAVLIGILNNNARLNDMNTRLAELRTHMDSRFSEMDRKMDQRFDDAKGVWRSELHRVEEVLDARLKHLEQR